MFGVAGMFTYAGYILYILASFLSSYTAFRALQSAFQLLTQGP